MSLEADAGSTVEFTGSLADGDAIWDRLITSCTSSSRDADIDGFRVHSPAAVSIAVGIEAVWDNDGFLYVFDSVLTTETAAASCVDGDDDHPTLGLDGSLLESVTIPAGATGAIGTPTFGSHAGPQDYTITVQTLSGRAPLGSFADCSRG